MLRKGVLFSSLINVNRLMFEPVTFMQVRSYAARKGTRERKKKKIVKVEVEKVGFIPESVKEKEKMLLTRPPRKFDDSWKMDPVDNVYVGKYYKWKTYAFQEAVQCHRETHHPDIYNKPNANLHVSIELNMQGEKKTRFVENFTRVVHVPHKFDHGEERRIIAFCKTAESQKEASDAGAELVGGGELIKQIQNGEVSLQDFQFFLAHPTILPELVSLRGLMKRKFPNPKAGSLGVDMGTLVQKFSHGINYRAVKDEYEKDFGIIETFIGTLDMDAKHLEENFISLVKDVNTMKPKREGGFISRCILWSPPSREKFKVDHDIYFDKEIKNEEVLEEDEELGERVAL